MWKKFEVHVITKVELDDHILWRKSCKTRYQVRFMYNGKADVSDWCSVAINDMASSVSMIFSDSPPKWPLYI